MELRDVVETLVGLDDERRALIGDVQRCLDGLERALLPPERFGIDARRIASLRERIGLGSEEPAALQSLSDDLRARLVDDARVESETLVRLAGEGRRTDNRLASLPSRWGAALDRARSAWENAGALRELLRRRRDVEARLRRVRERLGGDELAAELLDLVLVARLGEGEQGASAARAMLDEAERSALEDGTLAGVGANARAVRDAIAAGRDPAVPAADLVRRAVDAGLALSHDRDELRRELATLAREVERRQEISHGLFQAVTKASEVLDDAGAFESLTPSQQAADGALGPLKAACIEHGIIAVMLGLRDLQVDRRALDEATSTLSAALGDLLSRLEARPDVVSRLVPAWDDLAAVDARAGVAEWESACWAALGLRRDAHGVLSVAPEQLALLAAADSLDPWMARLVQRIEAKAAEVLRATERLDAIDAVLRDLSDDEAGPDVARSAREVRGALARFIGEALHVLGECAEAVQARVTSPTTGFAQIEQRIAAFRHVEEAAESSDPAVRLAAVSRTLAEVRELFVRLESLAFGEGTALGAEWKVEEERVRTASVAAQRRLASVLCRLRRLHALLLPPMATVVQDAVALAAGLARGASKEPARDHLGEALEALHAEKTFLRLLDLPPGDEVRPLATLAHERSLRRLDVLEASIVLLFRLLETLGRELDDSAGADRPGLVAWIEDLVAHAHEEVAEHAEVLDELLFELPDNAARAARWGAAFDAYHRWAKAAAESDAGMELAARAGSNVFERFETPLARLGTRALDAVRPEHADWRASSTLESLIDLYGQVSGRLEGVTTHVDVRGAIAASRRRAEGLRDAILAAAEREPDGRGDSGSLIFG